MKTRVLSFLFAVIFLLFSFTIINSTAPDCTVYAETLIKQTTGSLWLRTGPGTTYTGITVMPKGTRVEVLQISGKWNQVRYGTRIGWCSGYYLMTVSGTAAVPTPAPAPATSTTAKTEVTTANLWLRRGPGISYAGITVIPKGSRVTLIKVQGGWHNITWNGRTGWSSATYLRAVATAPAPTAAPKPTAVPTPKPTMAPTPSPKPATAPTAAPKPTTSQTIKPTVAPTAAPNPTAAPTAAPKPTTAPTANSTAAPTPKPTVTPSPVPTVTIEVTTANLWLRKGPGTSYAGITVMPKGSRVTLIKIQSGWHNVSWNGRTGWSSATYLQKVSTAPAVPPIVQSIPFVSQVTPLYAPVACENVSVYMVMKYRGYLKDIPLKTFLDKTPRHASNPEKGFVGTFYKPASQQPGLRTTIYPDPLVAYANTYGAKATNISGAGYAEIVSQVKAGNPVVAYVTTDFKTPAYSTFLIEGVKQYLISNNHVIVVTGYNPVTGDLRITDCWSESGSRREYWVSKSKFENAYNKRKQAILIK